MCLSKQSNAFDDAVGDDQDDDQESGDSRVDDHDDDEDDGDSRDDDGASPRSSRRAKVMSVFLIPHLHYIFPIHLFIIYFPSGMLLLLLLLLLLRKRWTTLLMTMIKKMIMMMIVLMTMLIITTMLHLKIRVELR